MQTGVTIVDSSVTATFQVAAYTGFWIDTRAMGGDGGTLHVVWEDVALTFQLLACSYPLFTPTSPPAHDWTAEYRAFDPAWVDPVLGDPRSQHPVRWKNLGFRFVSLHWTGGNWTGANRYLRIYFERDRYFR